MSIAICLFGHNKYWIRFLAKIKPLVLLVLCDHSLYQPVPFQSLHQIQNFPKTKMMTDIFLFHYIDLSSTSTKPRNFWAAKQYFR